MRKDGLVIKELFRGEVVQDIPTFLVHSLKDPWVIKYPSRYSWFLGDKQLTVKEATIYALLYKG